MFAGAWQGFSFIAWCPSVRVSLFLHLFCAVCLVSLFCLSVSLSILSVFLPCLSACLSCLYFCLSVSCLSVFPSSVQRVLRPAERKAAFMSRQANVRKKTQTQMLNFPMCDHTNKALASAPYLCLLKVPNPSVVVVDADGTQDSSMAARPRRW